MMATTVRLRIETICVVATALLCLGVVGGVVAEQPTVWFGVAAVGSLYPLLECYRNLDDNRPPGSEHLVPTLGVANAITVTRGVLLAAVAGFLLSDPAFSWLPAAGFLVAAAGDGIDGAVARRRQETVLGARLDASMDAYAVLVGGAVAVGGGSLPAWYLLAGFVWYGYTVALWIRKRGGRPVYGLPESRLRSVVGVGQLAVVGAGLLPGVSGPWLAVVAAIALCALSVSFIRDFAVATGRLPAERSTLSVIE